ncbi:Protein RMD9 mitochondrial [Meyerozyma sp. JA9]|nr:Protein RMD9 mitochondrial [Meyerozyma sp. JA9]
MFRLLASSGHASLRPVLLQHVRNNKHGLGFPNASGVPQSPSSMTSSSIVSPSQFSRSNSSAAGLSESPASSVDSKIENFLSKSAKDPLVREALDAETKNKLNYFKEQIDLANRYRSIHDQDSERAFASTLDNLSRALDDESLRDTFVSRDLFSYAQVLNSGVYNNRTNRLAGSKNRDSDQYHNQNLHDEVLLKQAVLHLGELITNGEFKAILNAPTLSFLFYSMKQFQLYPEMIHIWENGVNDQETGSVYLDEKILAVILPVTFEQSRFTYEEILHIYELNTEKLPRVGHELLTSMGKIAIAAGDYSRGLDSLESILQLYENAQQSHNKSKILASLSDLHLSFIGSCKDIKISKHFFDKVVHYDLPYRVKLKVPHIQSLLENCYEQNEPMDNILYFWRASIAHYNTENVLVLNSRYAILNNALFSIFFKKYPELNEDSFNKLREIIAMYAESKPIDEVFLNTIVGNYSWDSKEVLEQIIENYDVYNVKRTPVSYRVCLKKTGSLESYSNEEILQKWNASLQHLDSNKFTYIPVADWAALRDATILSKYKDARKEFYLSVLDKYKDYIQDHRSCIRFVRYWIKRKDVAADIDRVASNEPHTFDCDIDIQVPQFRHLRKNIDYVKEVQKIRASG